MIVFCDNPPLREKGFGLNVLTYNQLLGLGSAVRCVITFRSANGVSKSDILSDAAWPTLLADDPLGFIAERGMKGKVRALIEAVGFLASLPRIILLARKHSDSPFFVPVGASASTLWRICLLQSLVSNPFWPYFVDDIEQINSRLGRKGQLFLAQRLIPAILRRAARALVISEGLRKAYALRHGANCDVVLPCFKPILPTPYETSARPFTLVFSGGLSILYNDALILLQDALRIHNQTYSDKPARLILQTYSDHKQFNALGFDSTLVEYRTSEKRGDFASYREADCFVVPYSFDPAMDVMVATSFPQKVAELLQLGRPILFMGPPHSSVISFFKEQGVSHVVDSPSQAALNAELKSLILGPSDSSLQATYRKLHFDHFSPEATARLLGITTGSKNDR